MKKLVVILLLCSSVSVKAQDIHFSQFSKSSFLINPSLIRYGSYTSSIVLASSEIATPRESNPTGPPLNFSTNAAREANERGFG